MLEPGSEADHVAPELSLLDEALVRFEHVFDGVFEGDDVLGVALIHRLDHRGEGCGLARTGIAGHENKPAGEIGEPGDDLWESECAQRGDICFDRTHGRVR